MVAWNYLKIQLYFKNLFVKEFDSVICIGASKARPIGGSIISAYLAEPEREKKQDQSQKKNWKKSLPRFISFNKISWFRPTCFSKKLREKPTQFPMRTPIRI